MRALVLSIVLLVGCQKPNEIANSADSKTVPNEIANSTDSKTVPNEFANSIGMKLVLIHPGSFTMGSPVREIGREEYEPQHEVTLTKSYFLGAYEVTQDQYQKVMGRNPSYFKGAKNPVESVSWEDAVSFCKKLSKMPEEKAAGRSYRLPTEAEWEYACRAGSTKSYSFGETAESLGEYAWFEENSERKTHPVGEKKPNRWGLYDMHGNVWDYCQDVEDHVGPMEEYVGRMSRGGSWTFAATACRSASRRSTDLTFRAPFLGFRIALSPSVKQPEADQDK